MRCQGCKLDDCVSWANISPTLFEYLSQGEMDDFYWFCRESRVNFLESDTKEVIKGSVVDIKEEIISSLREDINKIVDMEKWEKKEEK